MLFWQPYHRCRINVISCDSPCDNCRLRFTNYWQDRFGIFDLFSFAYLIWGPDPQPWTTDIQTSEDSIQYITIIYFLDFFYSFLDIILFIFSRVYARTLMYSKYASGSILNCQADSKFNFNSLLEYWLWQTLYQRNNNMDIIGVPYNLYIFIHLLTNNSLNNSIKMSNKLFFS